MVKRKKPSMGMRVEGVGNEKNDEKCWAIS